MRKVVMFNRVSVDGFYAGADGNMDWFVTDHEARTARHPYRAAALVGGSWYENDIKKLKRTHMTIEVKLHDK
jgi:hypothetical protein